MAAFARAPSRWRRRWVERALLAPIRLRIGLHTGEVQLRDEANYTGPTINRAARLRDLGHGGQTLFSGATEPWLSTGYLRVRGCPIWAPTHYVICPARSGWCSCAIPIGQRVPAAANAERFCCPNLPVQLTSFVGRDAELTQLRELLATTGW